MEPCFSLTNKPQFLSTPKPQTSFKHGHRSFKLQQQTKQQVGWSGGRLRAAGCGTGGGAEAAEFERKLEDEMGSMEEWIGVAGEKCRDGNGIVELMECLETEAIMGEDQGREPKDYIGGPTSLIRVPESSRPSRKTAASLVIPSSSSNN